MIHFYIRGRQSSTRLRWLLLEPVLLFRPKIALLMVSLLCLSFSLRAQSTYSWNGLTSTSFETATNWTPARTTPATSDILVIAKNGTITSVPTQTIGSLFLQSSAQVIMQAKTGATRTLTLSATSGIDIGSGCTLSITGTALLQLTVNNNCKIAGRFVFHPSLAETFLIKGNLNGTGGTIDLGPNAVAHQLILQGTTHSLSTLTTPATTPAQVIYDGASDSGMFGSLAYPNLIIDGGGVKRQLGNISAKGTLQVADGTTMQVDAFNLTVAGKASLEGDITDANNAGVSTFSSLVEVGLNGSLQALSATASFSFAHSLAVKGTLLAKNGQFTFSGTGKTISLAFPVVMSKAAITGTYVVVGERLDISSMTITDNGYLRHKSVSFPKNIPSAENIRGFNHPFFSASNKFSLFSLSPTASVTTTDTDISFTKSSTGKIYAARTLDKKLDPAPTALMVSFDLSVNSTVAQANAAMLMLGSNFDSTNLTSTTGADRLGFSLSATSGVSLTHNDGTTSAVQPSSAPPKVIWVVNNTSTFQTYTPPNAATYNPFAGDTIAARSSHLWIVSGTTMTRVWKNKPMLSTTFNLTGIKMMFTAGSGTITLKNLTLSPLANITLDAIPCFTPGTPFTIPFTVTQTMSSGPIASFNIGNTFRVECTSPGGGWINSVYAGMPAPITITIPNSLRFDPLTGKGFIDGFIQNEWNLSDPRVKVRLVTTNSYVMSFINPGDRATQTNTMWYIKSTSYPQTLDAYNLTGDRIVAARGPSTTGPITLQWGYSTEPDGPFVAIPGQRGQGYNTVISDFPGKGTYYVKCLKTQAGAECYSNPIIIYVNCDAPVNLIKNGDFSQVGTRIQRYDSFGNPIYDFNDINGNGVIEYNLGEWDTDYRDGAKNNNADLFEGDYIVGTDPGVQARIEWCSQVTTANYRDGMLDSAGQARYGLLGYSPGGGGNMLIANANDEQSQILWGQHIYGLKLETDYVLTFWAAGVSTNNPQTLTFGAFINCRRVGDDISDRYNTQCHWNKYTVQFNTGALRDAYISINNIAATRSGNDIALDDIQLIECGGTQFKPFIEFVWRGYTSDWFLPDNWGTCDEIPDCLDRVTIPAGKYNYPIINSDAKGLALAKELTIEKGASITLSSNGTSNFNLYVCGNVKNDGAVIGPGKFVFQGNVEQMVSSKTGTFENVTITQPGTRGVFIFDYKDIRTGLTLPSTMTITGELDISPANKLYISHSTFTTLSHRLFLQGTLSYNTGTLVGSPKASLLIAGFGDLEGYLRFNSSITSGTTLKLLSMERSFNGMATLGTPLTVDSLLTLKEGVLYTSTTPVAPSSQAPVLSLSAAGKVASSSAHVSGGSDESYIDGPMSKYTTSNGFFTFPIGKKGHLGEAGIAANTSLFSCYQAEYFLRSALLVGGTIEAPLSDVNTVEYWRIDRLSGDAAKVALHYTSFSDSQILSSNRGYLQVSRYGLSTNDALQGTTTTNGVWRQKGNSFNASTSATSGYVISDLVSAFSPFTIGISTYLALPVTMISLTATKKDKTVLISFQTSLEKDTDHFRVLRSANGIDFAPIGTIKAAGTSQAIKSYQFTDLLPMESNYYRIETVDRDDSKQLSKIVFLSMLSSAPPQIRMYPNPATVNTLYVEANLEGTLFVSIYDVLGCRVGSFSVEKKSEPLNLLQGSLLKKGMYIISLNLNGYTYTQKVILN